MSQLKELLDREASRIDADPGALESVMHRRDRERRNQRITAGMVGIAVSLVAVWIVTSVMSVDRTEHVVVPATPGSTEPPDATWDGYGIPPEGTRLSAPVQGVLIKRYLGEDGSILLTHGSIQVYADGRVISYEQGTASIWGGGQVLERRLTREGVNLVRSGAKLDDIPDSAWADAEPRVYAPPTYELCLSSDGPFDPSAAMDMLPESAQALLREIGASPLGGSQGDECPVVATADARALDEMLRDAGLDTAFTSDRSANAWYVRGESGPYLSIFPLLPGGDRLTKGPA